MKLLNNSFPARAIFSKEGKPLLSWRVAILPYIEEQTLYDQFHQDEPWDSPHNKQLIARIPATYRDPERPADGTTTFLAPVGKGLAWEGDAGLAAADFKDGMSNTILCVQANEARAVPWTKPDDLEVDLNKPLDGLFGNSPTACAVFCDAHVSVFTPNIAAETLKALFTRNGGEVIGDSDLP